jgi:hypothetical protein
MKNLAPDLKTSGGSFTTLATLIDSVKVCTRLTNQGQPM